MKRTRGVSVIALAAVGLSVGLSLVGVSWAAGYQPTQQNAYVAQNPSSCNKSPCILYPKSVELPGGRLIMGFEDSEGPVIGQTLPIYKSDDNGDTWQKLTNVLPPASLTTDPDYAPYTSNWTNPYFYVLPQALGTLQAGTLMLADVVSGGNAGTTDRTGTAIVLYVSTDQGATWTVVSTIATGDRGYSDPVWEPYIMMYQGQLVVYYSDENDYLGFDPATGIATIDPANATASDSGGQVLVHRTWTGSGSWSSPVVDVAGLSQDMGSGKTEIGKGRPGMTNVVPTSDGKWLLTYEYWGGGDNVNYKIASNPLQFFAVGNPAGSGISTLPVSTGSGKLAQGGSPVLVRLPDGRLVYNAAGSGDVWVNESGSSTGAWKQYHTSVASGYSRNLQYVTATGRIEILRAPWGTGPVSYGQVDLGSSNGVYYALVNRKTGQVLTPQAGKTQDAAFTGNAADIMTLARNDSSVGQWWHLARKGSSVSLLNKSGGRALGIWMGSASAGANLAQWVDDGGSDKLWNLVATGDGYYRLQSTSNASLYVTSATAGSVDLEATTTDTGQQWQVVADFSTIGQAGFSLVNAGSGKVAGIYQGSVSNGAAAVQWTANGSADQIWKLTPLSNGNYTITDAKSGKVLGVSGGQTTPGAAAIQWTNSGSADQQWSLVANGPYFALRNVNSGLNLGVQAGSSTDGAALIQWTPDSSASQQWQLAQVAGD